jgi:TPR repeat protein
MIRRLISLIFLISIISTFPLILTSCGGIPVHARPETGLPCREDVEDLIGHTKSDISNQFGEPDYQFEGADNEYFIYEGYGVVDVMWDVFIPFIILPGEIYGNHEVFYCVLIEFDKESRVIRYDSDWEWSQIPHTCDPLLFTSEMRSKIISHLQGQASVGNTNAVFVLANFFKTSVSEYRDVLIRNAQAGDAESAYILAVVFSEDNILKKLALKEPLAREKLHKLILSKYGIDYKELQEKSSQGDEYSQWKLYESMPTKESLAWLCREADEGSTRARNELGRLYLHGSDQYREILNAHIPADISRACMWFNLSGLVQIATTTNMGNLEYALDPYTSNQVQRTAKVMTEKELTEAERLIQTWAPGQCSKNIARYNSARTSELTELCNAADQGVYQARDKLGWIYFMGSHGVEADRRYAYMWYYLAATVYAPPKMEGNMQDYCDSMTDQQRLDTLKMLEEWSPGRCEKDLLE